MKATRVTNIDGSVTLHADSMRASIGNKELISGMAMGMGFFFEPQADIESRPPVTRIDIEQLRRDFDNGVIICRATWQSLLDNLPILAIETVGQIVVDDIVT